MVRRVPETVAEDRLVTGKVTLGGERVASRRWRPLPSWPPWPSPVVVPLRRQSDPVSSPPAGIPKAGREWHTPPPRSQLSSRRHKWGSPGRSHAPDRPRHLPVGCRMVSGVVHLGIPARSELPPILRLCPTTAPQSRQAGFSSLVPPGPGSRDQMARASRAGASRPGRDSRRATRRPRMPCGGISSP
jgi:hypothetical protein